MNIFRLIFDLFVIYMIYKLIFDFIIPVFTTTKQMKQKMTEMQQKMQEQQGSNKTKSFSKPEEKKVEHEDYIDYEEIKETNK